MPATDAILLALAAHPAHERAASSSVLTWWNFEPGLILSLLVFAGLYATGVWRLWQSAGAGKGISRAQVGAFSAGWLTLIVALVSPVDALSDSLLWVHMVQHELLMIVAAPLIALSAPLVAGVWALRLRIPRTFHALGWLTAPAFVFLLHAFALWIWHLPSLYDAALEHESVHIAQHICFFSSACLFWWGMLHGRYGRLGYGAAVIYLFATAMHSGVLGALLTVAPYPWYRDYITTTSAWGYTPLEDQQVAGLIMWIPASLVFLVAGLAFLAAWLRESERRVRILQTRA
jgi:putative membrane protein